MEGCYAGASWNGTGMWTYSARQTHSHSGAGNNDACCSFARSQGSSRVSIGAAHSRADVHDTQSAYATNTHSDSTGRAFGV